VLSSSQCHPPWQEHCRGSSTAHHNHSRPQHNHQTDSAESKVSETCRTTALLLLPLPMRHVLVNTPSLCCPKHHYSTQSTMQNSSDSRCQVPNLRSITHRPVK
jgi:hypothetical protein